MKPALHGSTDFNEHNRVKIQEYMRVQVFPRDRTFSDGSPTQKVWNRYYRNHIENSS